MNEIKIYPIGKDESKHRRQGAGRALIAALEKLLEEAELKETDDAGMPIRVRYTSVSEDNGLLLPFFRSMGFAEDPIPHPMYYIGYLDDLKSRDKLPAKVSAKSKDSIMTFSEAGERLLKTASNESIQQGNPLPEGGLLAGSVDRELSLCVVRLIDYLFRYVEPRSYSLVKFLT